MALQFLDRVRVTTATTGTGAIAIGAAVAGYQGFSGMTVGNTAYYVIEDGANWEIGVGTLTSSSTWTRTTVISTSAGTTSPINLDGAAILYLGWTAEAIALYATLNAPSFAGPVAITDTSSSAPTLSVTDSGSGSNATVTVAAPNNADGVAIKLTGNGTTTPSKWLRVYNGALNILSSAYTSIFNLDDAGDLTLAGSITAGVNASSLVVGSGNGQTNLAASWTQTTPTVTAGSGTLTTVSCICRYAKEGPTVRISYYITITTNGTGAADIIVPLPFAAQSFTTQFVGGREVALTGKALTGTINAGGTTFAVLNYDNSYPGANGAVLVLSGTYEAAS